MATLSTHSDVSGLDLIKSIPEALELYQKALADIERYRLIFGEIPATYGKVDVMTAFKTYRENESFHQNFGRYVEALKAKLEVNTAASTSSETKPEVQKNATRKERQNHGE